MSEKNIVERLGVVLILAALAYGFALLALSRDHSEWSLRGGSIGADAGAFDADDVNR